MKTDDSSKRRLDRLKEKAVKPEEVKGTAVGFGKKIFKLIDRRLQRRRRR